MRLFAGKKGKCTRQTYIQHNDRSDSFQLILYEAEVNDDDSWNKKQWNYKTEQWNSTNEHIFPKKIRPIDPNLSLNLYKSNEKVKVLLIDTHSVGLFFWHNHGNILIIVQ